MTCFKQQNLQFISVCLHKMTRLYVYITQIGGVGVAYPCRQKVQILLFKSKWDLEH
jgi:hypothetical protein